MLDAVAVAFTTIFLSEFGDKSRLVAFALSARYKAPLPVFAGMTFAYLLLDDTGTVVFDDDAEPVLCHLDDLDGYLGRDAGFFACVERVVDRLFDRGHERFAGVVETEEVLVAREELGDAYLTLFFGELDRFGLARACWRSVGR